MSALEPPGVLTRPPSCVSPDLPASPASPSSPTAPQNTPLENSLASLSEPHHTHTHQATMPSTLDDTTDYGTVTLKRTKRRPEDGSREPRWRELLKECRLLLTLENSGSVARDHLASERTFLAYARTSLTITSTGVALVQLFTLSAATMNLERYARPLGASMIGIGLLTLTIGVRRYYLIQDSLIRGMYPVSRVSTSLLSFALLVVVLVVFILILASGE